MSQQNYIALNDLCSLYKLEMSFFTHLNEFGLIEIRTIKKTGYIHQDEITDVEKIIRLHTELNINIEGIDTVLNLLERINELETELINAKNRLRLYED